MEEFSIAVDDHPVFLSDKRLLIVGLLVENHTEDKVVGWLSIALFDKEGESVSGFRRTTTWPANFRDTTTRSLLIPDNGRVPATLTVHWRGEKIARLSVAELFEASG